MISPQSTHLDELSADAERFLPASYLRHHPVIVAHGQGSHLTDVAGREYIDFASGIAAVNLGHCHPTVTRALELQAASLQHTGPVTLHEGYVRVAARLAGLVGGRDRQVLLVNSGAEAIENAVKIARHATRRDAVITFDRSFHGRTYLTSSLSGRSLPYKTQPGGVAPNVFHAPFPYPFRPPRGVDQGELTAHCLEALDDLLRARVPPERVAAIIVEPIQGEGGYVVPTPGFLQGISRMTRDIGALLIVDEIQTGYGRTGRMFGFEHDDLAPDIVAVGKSMANGMPVGAVVADREVMDKVVPGDIGGTFGGNPLVAAAALAVFQVFEEERILDTAPQLGAAIRHLLGEALEGMSSVGEIRGRGPMLAIEIVEDRETKRPAPAATAEIIARAREEGVLVIKTGPYDSVIRVVPPLTTDRGTLEAGVASLRRAFLSANR